MYDGTNGDAVFATLLADGYLHSAVPDPQTCVVSPPPPLEHTARTLLSANFVILRFLLPIDQQEHLACTGCSEGETPAH